MNPARGRRRTLPLAADRHVEGSGLEGWICASAWANVTFATPSAARWRRASSSIRDDRSTPSAEPAACGHGRVPGRLTGPAADVEHPVGVADRGRRHQPFVVGGDRTVEVVGVVSPVRALVTVPGVELLDIRRVDGTALVAVMRPPATLPLGV